MLRLSFAVSSLFILTVCATVITGTTQSVGVSSNPAGATATINPGGLTVATPAQVELKVNRSYTVLVERDGYESGSTAVSSRISGWVWGNLVIGGLIGLAIDFISGGAYKLTPETLSVDLVRKPEPPPVKEPEVETLPPEDSEEPTEK